MRGEWPFLNSSHSMQQWQILDFPPNAAQFPFHFRCRHEREMALSVFPIPLTLLSMKLPVMAGQRSLNCAATEALP